jgi:hypothetical protein
VVRKFRLWAAENSVVLAHEVDMYVLENAYLVLKVGLLQNVVRCFILFIFKHKYQRT